MKNITIKMTRDNFNYKFKQYEGMYFNACIDPDSDIVKYTITSDKEGKVLKEFGNTHIKNQMLFIPQLDVYMDLNKIK